LAEALQNTRTSIAAGINARVFYGWVMVAVAGLGIFASGPGQSHTFSVFVGPIGADLGISVTSIALAYALATVGAAFLLPYVGKQVDRFGPRASLVGIVIALGLACLFFGAAANMLWLIIGFGLLRFLGQGSMMLGSANLVAHWFSARRGFAMSLMALGFSASMAVHPQLGRYLIEAFGWREAWIGLGLLTWALMIPVLLVLVHDKPEDLGLSPDNVAEPSDEAGKKALTGATLEEALRFRSFYLLALGWASLAGLVTTLHFHNVTVMTMQGLEPAWATSAFTIAAVTMVFMMPLVGRSFDRFRTRWVFAAALLVQSAALVAVTFVSTVPALVVYGIIFGLNNAFSMTMFGYIWPRYFGRKHLGRIQGTGQMVGVFAASLGPLPVSFAIDAWGDPTGMLWALALIPLVAAVLAVLLLQTHPSVSGAEHLE
jgi:MFS family permease